MSITEQSFLIWACLALLTIISFVGIIFVNSFLKMAKDINDIKLNVSLQVSKHQDLKRRVCNLETYK